MKRRGVTVLELLITMTVVLVERGVLMACLWAARWGRRRCRWF